MALLSIVTQQCKQAVIEFHSNETVVYGLLLIVINSRVGCSWVRERVEVGRDSERYGGR
jgi:hypothetical protein